MRTSSCASSKFARMPWASPCRECRQTSGMGGDPDTWESQPVMLILHNGGVVAFDY
jgi:hypothetical protein